MTGFSADWLALREPFDQQARAAAAGVLDLDAFAARLRDRDPVIGVIDLACGTGANLRELAPRLGGSQRWTLIDHDAMLLKTMPEVLEQWAQANGFAFRAAAGGRMHIEAPNWNVELRPMCLDLACQLDAVPFAVGRLVTASALLDLVSASWLEALFDRVRAAGAAMLFGLSVHGTVAWEPTVADDEEVHRLFASHQRRNKGFGPGLGEEAVRFALSRLKAIGYDVAEAASDWRVDGRGGDAQAIAMLNAMREGMGAAAIEQDPAAQAMVSGWTKRRSEVVDQTRLRIGHRDILAI